MAAYLGTLASELEAEGSDWPGLVRVTDLRPARSTSPPYLELPVNRGAQPHYTVDGMGVSVTNDHGSLETITLL